jgi:hypothetical protein
MKRGRKERPVGSRNLVLTAGRFDRLGNSSPIR